MLSSLLNHVEGEGAWMCGKGGREALGETMVEMEGKDRCTKGLAQRRHTIGFEEKRM